MRPKFPHIRPLTTLRWYSLLAVLGTGSAAGWLLAIPSESGNAWLLGVSQSRWALLLPLGLFGAVSLAVFLLNPAGNGLYPRVYRRLGNLLSRPGIQAWVLALAMLAAILALYGIFASSTLSGVARRPIFIRLTPLFAWVAWISLQTLAFLGFHAIRSGRQRRSLDAFRNLYCALLVFGVAWFARGLALDQFVTIDEPTWLRRGSQFYIALQNRDYEQTYLFGHPGVTLMWAKYASLSSFLSLPQELDYGSLTANQLDYLLLKQGYSRIEILAATRFFISITNALVISLFFVYAARLTSTIPAFTGALLLALDPFHAAHSHLLAMDALLASFMGLSVVAFLGYLRNRQKAGLFMSGAAAGLAWLTKSPGFFLIPVLCLAAAVWQADRARRSGLPVRWRSEILTWLTTMIAWGLTGLLVFSAFFPAMWVAPVATLRNIFATALGYAASGHQGLVFWNGRVIPDGQIRDLTFYPATFLWRTTPVALAGLAMAAAGLLFPTRIQGMDRKAVLGLLSSALLIWLIMNIGTKRFDRYFLPVYPLLDLAAGAGLATLATAFQGWSGKASISLLAAMICLQAGLLVSVHPYYLSYYNPLMGGPARAPEVMMIGWGEGLDEAGRYLSSKPNSENLEVVTWYNQGPFSYFFNGDSLNIAINTPPSKNRLERFMEADYIVIYIHQWQRNSPAELLSALSERKPEHSVWIDGLEYVRIYKTSP